jgi:hypothetical protein
MRLGYNSLFLIAIEVDATFEEVNILMCVIQNYTDLGFEFIVTTRELNKVELKE